MALVGEFHVISAYFAKYIYFVEDPAMSGDAGPASCTIELRAYPGESALPDIIDLIGKELRCARVC